MRVVGQLAAVLGAAVVLSGCHYYYGVRREATLAAAPPLSCIESAIRSVPGVDDVRHEVREGSRPLTLTGLKGPDEVHEFIYSTGETGSSVQIVIDYRGQAGLSQSLTEIGGKPPQEHVDRVRPIMIRIEQALEQRCGMETLSASINEECRGVFCASE